MTPVNPMDYSMKPQVDISAIANTLQRKRQIEIETKQQQRTQRMNELSQTIGLATNLASTMVQHSKDKQKADFVKSLAESMAASVPKESMPVEGPTLDNSPLPSIMSQDPRKQALMRNATLVNPEAASEFALSQNFPKPMTGNAARPVPMKLEFPDGTQGLGYFEPTTHKYMSQDGTEAPLGTRGAYKYDLREDAAGNLNAISGASGKIVNEINTSAPRTGEISEEAKSDNVFVLPAKRRVEFVKAVDAAKNEPAFRGEINKLQAAQTFSKSLSAENQILDSGAALQFRKVFGDAGNISIVEQQASEGDRQIFERAKQYVSRNLTSGKLTDHNREVMRGGLKVLTEAAEKNLLYRTMLEADSLQGQYPELKRDAIASNIVGKATYKRLSKKYPNVRPEVSPNESDGPSPESEADSFMSGLFGGQ